jgi:excisionase family DNA binding protein
MIQHSAGVPSGVTPVVKSVLFSSSFGLVTNKYRRMDQNNITQVHGITPQQLRENILKDVRTELKEIVLNFQPTKQPEYLTRKEVAIILKVSLVTLSDWNKKGVLKPYRLGNLIRYKRAELDQALISINSKKR